MPFASCTQVRKVVILSDTANSNQPPGVTQAILRIGVLAQHDTLTKKTTYVKQRHGSIAVPLVQTSPTLWVSLPWVAD